MKSFDFSKAFELADAYSAAVDFNTTNWNSGSIGAVYVLIHASSMYLDLAYGNRAPNRLSVIALIISLFTYLF